MLVALSNYYGAKEIVGRFGFDFLESFQIWMTVQCNLDLVTFLVSIKTVTKMHNVTKSNDFM